HRREAVRDPDRANREGDACDLRRTRVFGAAVNRPQAYDYRPQQLAVERLSWERSVRIDQIIVGPAYSCFLQPDRLHDVFGWTFGLVESPWELVRKPPRTRR